MRILQGLGVGRRLVATQVEAEGGDEDLFGAFGIGGAFDELENRDLAVEIVVTAAEDRPTSTGLPSSCSR